MAFGVSFRKAITGFPFKGFVLASTTAKAVAQADLELLVLFYFPAVGKIIGVSRHTQFPFKVLFVSLKKKKKVICRSKISH